MHTKLIRSNGFTLVEIMIVVAIIGLLASVAIPSLARARRDAQTRTCQVNLKTMAGAKEMWALEMGKTDQDTPTDGDLFGPGRAISDKPHCPAGGTYHLNALCTKPTCSVVAHTL